MRTLKVKKITLCMVVIVILFPSVISTMGCTDDEKSSDKSNKYPPIPSDEIKIAIQNTLDFDVTVYILLNDEPLGKLDIESGEAHVGNFKIVILGTQKVEVFDDNWVYDEIKWVKNGEMVLFQVHHNF